jgi:hypothetical protein
MYVNYLNETNITFDPVLKQKLIIQPTTFIDKELSVLTSMLHILSSLSSLYSDYHTESMPSFPNNASSSGSLHLSDSIIDAAVMGYLGNWPSSFMHLNVAFGMALINIRSIFPSAFRISILNSTLSMKYLFNCTNNAGLILHDWCSYYISRAVVYVSRGI